MGDMLRYIPAALCLLYYLLIVLYAGMGADFAWIWLFFAAILLMTHAPVIGRAVSVLLLIGLIGMAVVLVPVIRGMFGKPVDQLEVIIVEGAQVRGTVPSRSLTRRLERALSYAQNNPETVLILSGGQGSGEDISEADCMYSWLTAQGLAPERMYSEDQSTSTRENLLFSNQLYACADRSVGIVTNDFHICRSLMLARSLGYKDVHGIPAKSDPVLQVHFVVREVFALVYGLVK